MKKKKENSKVRNLREINHSLRKLRQHLFFMRCCYCDGKDDFTLVEELLREHEQVQRCNKCGKKNIVRSEGNIFFARPYDFYCQSEDSCIVEGDE